MHKLKTIQFPINLPPKAAPWLIWSLGLAFGLIQFFTQIATSHFGSLLMQEFAIDAKGLGLLSSAFFYPFIIMQIPAGMLLDKFGPRTILIKALLVLSTGCIIFAASFNLPMAYIGRMLMGAGSAFGFIGMLALASTWFSAQKFVLLVGASEMLAFSVLASTQFMMPSWVEFYGWRKIIFGCGVLTFCLSITYFILAQESKTNLKIKSTRFKIKNALKHTFGNFAAWAAGLVSGFICVILTAFAGLWGVQFLMSVHYVNNFQAGIGSAAVLLGIAAGAPIMGYWSNKIAKRNLVLKFNIFALIVIFLSILIFKLQPILLYSLLFMVGATSSVYVLCYSIGKELVPAKYQSVMMGFINMLTMCGALFIQPIIGVILDLVNPGNMVNNLPVYSKEAYQIALGVLVICFGLGFILCWLIPETYCKDKYKTPNWSASKCQK